MTQIHVRFPVGNGGFWLGYLIQCLELNQRTENTDVHYHMLGQKTRISHSLTPSHPEEIIFGGSYFFNMFANYVKKVNFETAIPVGDQYTANVCTASHLLEFECVNPDLLSDSIYKNNYNNFRDSLFDVLDNSNIEYCKNNQICQTLFDEYRSKLADPAELFNNWNNINWIYWCLGITKKELGSFPSDAPIDVLVDWLRPHKNFVLDYTEQRMYKSNT